MRTVRQWADYTLSSPQEGRYTLVSNRRIQEATFQANDDQEAIKQSIELVKAWDRRATNEPTRI